MWIPQLLTILTGRKRSKQEIVYYRDQWFSNCFRFLDSIFWRECNEDGTEKIRPFSTLVAYENEYGETVHELKFHCLEAMLCHYEAQVRKFFKVLSSVRVYVPVAAVPGGVMYLSPFLFAIAWDNALYGGDTTSTSITDSYTMGSGSNRYVFCGASNFGTNNDRVTGITYATVAMAKPLSAVNAGIGTWDYTFTLVAPATGANNFVISVSPSDRIVRVYSSYSGVDQTTPNNNTSQTTGNSSDATVTVTPTVDNCWGTGTGIQANGTASAGVNFTERASYTTTKFIMAGDSNATITNGVGYTMHYNPGGTWAWGMMGIAIAPAVAAATTTPHLLTLTGIGK